MDDPYEEFTLYRTLHHRLQRVVAWSVIALATLALAVVASGVGPSSFSTHAVAPHTRAGVPAKLSSTPAPPRIVVTPSLVVAVSGSSLVVQGPNGPAVHYVLDASTVVLRGRSIATRASLAAGERVIVVASPRSTSVAGTIGIIPSSSGSDDGIASPSDS